jgi:hypothetical protein
VIKDLINAVEQLKSKQPPSSVYLSASEATPSTSRPKQPGLSEKETKHREAIRSYYRQKLKPLQFKHLKEDLVVDIWTTVDSVRKAAFLSRFPGIKWSDAISHVVQAKTSLKKDLLKQADTEIASYYLSKKNRLPSHPGIAPTPWQDDSVVLA